MNHQYTIGALKELIAVRCDCEQGFTTCAEYVVSERLKKIFMIHARESAEAIHVLEALVRRLGGDPEAHGPLLSLSRRGWDNLSATLACSDDRAILDACERGESRLLEVYRNALDDHLPDFVRSVVLGQFEGAMSNHDQIRELSEQRIIHENVAAGTRAQARQY
jgi:uncharacterized protein (TIGR02284 family)